MKLAAVVLFVITIFTGCTSKETQIDKATDLRKNILNANSCSFSCVINADYGDTVYTFKMDCIADNAGDLHFNVTDPETISGITGTIRQDRAELTFDDRVLAFPMLANDQIAPVSAPWLFLNTLRSGYITGCGREEAGYMISIDDSYREHPLQLLVHTDDNFVPLLAEIFWREQRILTLDVRNFTLQ